MKIVNCWFVILIMCFCQMAYAQVEKEAEIRTGEGGVINTFSVQSEDGTVNRIALPVVTDYSVSGTMWSSSAMPYYSNADAFSQIHDPSVRKDLELVDDQYSQIKKIQTEFQERLSSLMKEYPKSKGDNERIKDISLAIQKIQKDKKEALSDVLLPHQLERLKQVSRQIHMKNMGTGPALQHGELAKELEISKDQKKNLAKIQADLQKELQQLRDELKADAKKKLLSELTAEQRTKLKELTGDEFKRNPRDWQPKKLTPPKRK